MKDIRLIARLDIKSPNLIKGINLEGVRVIGDPQYYAERYYQQGIDELFYMDAVATLFNRNSLEKHVSQVANNIFIPLTVGGGIRNLYDVNKMLSSGADKIAVNTAAIHHPSLITDIAKRFGSQCMVLSVEAKRTNNAGWEAYTDNGRNKTNKDVILWVKEAEALGVGEILLTSVDQEGTAEGFDIALIQQVTEAVSVPVIASGGMGTTEHMLDAIIIGGANAIAMAHVLHYDTLTINQLKSTLVSKNYRVRIGI